MSYRFCFEAAVCGGIPIIHTLHSAYLGDRVTKMVGIMNGTTNFMLCKMEDEGADYGDALKEAQRLGFGRRTQQLMWRDWMCRPRSPFW